MAEEILVSEDDLQEQQAALLAAAAKTNILIKNHYYLYDDIDMDSAKNMVVNMSELAMTIAQNSLTTGMEICPIHLHICSHGGDLTASLAIVKLIEDIKVGNVAALGNFKVPIEVYTHIEGEADSGASLIACVGSKRYCSRNALSLVHPMRSMDLSMKTTVEQEQELANNNRWNSIYKRIYIEHSNLKEKDLEKMFEKEKFYTPEELVRFGLVDEIEE